MEIKNVSREEFLSFIQGLDEKYLSRTTFEFLLQHIEKSLFSQLELRDNTFLNDLATNVSNIEILIQELQKQQNVEANDRMLLQQREINNQLLLTQIKEQLNNHREDIQIIVGKSEIQEKRQQSDELRLDRLEEGTKKLRKDIFGRSSRGENLTLIERIAEAEITFKDHEYRLGSLEKLSPKNYEIVEAVKQQTEILKTYNLVNLLSAKLLWHIRYASGNVLQFIKNRRKNIAEAFAQSILVRILLFLIGIIGSSPIWIKIVEDFVKHVFK